LHRNIAARTQTGHPVSERAGWPAIGSHATLRGREGGLRALAACKRASAQILILAPKVPTWRRSAARQGDAQDAEAVELSI